MSGSPRDWLWLPQRTEQPASAPPASSPSAADAPPVAPPDRFAFVIDDNESICRILSLTLTGLGVACETFSNAKDALAALDRRRPAVMFLDVALSQSDAIDVVHGLNAKHYAGVVHLMSGNPSLIEAVQRIGARKGVTFGVPLHKPFRRETILGILDGHGLTRAATPADKPA